jgi:NhaP-type Na+/H+ or K+/H+ antiporter
MLSAVLVIVVAAMAGVLAGYLLWWVPQRAGAWSLLLGPVVGLAMIVLLVLVSFVLVWLTYGI